MKHDDKWLSDESKKAYNDTEHVMPVDIADVAVRYHEHMTRWRSISEPPDDGARIELVGETGYGSIEFPDEATNPLLELCIMHDAIAWRYAPLGEQPKFDTGGAK